MSGDKSSLSKVPNFKTSAYKRSRGREAKHNDLGFEKVKYSIEGIQRKSGAGSATIETPRIKSPSIT